jgi:hypothetical protein
VCAFGSWASGSRLRASGSNCESVAPSFSSSQQLITRSVQLPTHGTRQKVETDCEAKQIAPYCDEASQGGNPKPGARSLKPGVRKIRPTRAKSSGAPRMRQGKRMTFGDGWRSMVR